MDLRNKWVVVTGGSSGIGFAIARRLVARGNRVTLVADGVERLAAAAAALRSEGGDVDYIPCDLGIASDVVSLADAVLARGVPDVLVNNAGFGVYRSFEASSPGEVDRLLEVNLTGHVRLTKRLLGPMVVRKSGAICFMASIAGRVPITPNAVYCAAKYGMMGIGRTLRYELHRFNIGVSVICPGRVETRFFEHETFRSRKMGPETKGVIGADEVARATLNALERNRALTYVPAVLGPGAWLFSAFSLLLEPLYRRVVRARMEDYYANPR